MSGRHRHESITASILNCLAPCRHERVIRTWEGNPVNDDQPTRVTRNVHPLPQGQGPEEACPRISRESAREIGQMSLPLTQHRNVRHDPAHVFGSSHRVAVGGEQPEGTSTSGPDQLGKIVENLWRDAISTRARQGLTDIQNPLLRVVER